MNPGVSIEAVGNALRALAEQFVLPRFRRLRDGDVMQKAHGEIVTVVDQDVEEALAPQLRALLPGSRVVGEEATSADPGLLDALDQGWVWLLDPVDGTSNFAAGREAFAMMVALLRDGVAVASWIYSPISGRLAVAELGSGAFVDGVAVRTVEPAKPAALSGVVKTRYLPADFVGTLARGPGGLAAFDEGCGSAGIEYPALVEGHWRFLLYWRTLAWDHVPGSLFVTEAGGHVARLDGSPYLAADVRAGLLAASSHEAWLEARALLPR
ncbi:inositol monophosphatase family protein [Uliginosibacterium sp. H3]|uniref:Inositol monophosphatase family protein n=1 Tax=Uliginosibacterium silvisoli TaxID=3114758 RepID=A0ABU6K7B3_9RHOO|nr:inositol monophosphatase family protein [Uliginosibacterium sp. H3]